MSEYSELKKAAEALIVKGSHYRRHEWEDFLELAQPDVVLVLIAENSRLKMFNTAYADTITKLNGMIKFEKEQSEALRKDAERYRGMFNDNYGFDYSDRWVGKSKEEVDGMIDGHD